ncbi:hypothetical protein PVL29_004589 [Vitis rotundifolia]|uniref:Uncharacterized protein n=1 Tax=Vitis rotundifolia TaxID=103349 RepID=A0AA39AAP4_VITRO|nr:hypothetical protein PVL29_004589 [Vitis rotundifolia]
MGITLNVLLTLFTLSWVHCILLGSLIYSQCFNPCPWNMGKVDPVGSLYGINSVVDSIATLNINPNVDLKTDEPIIIPCFRHFRLQRRTIAISTTHLNPKPKKDLTCNDRSHFKQQAWVGFQSWAVKKLLSQGADANYYNKQGLSVLHLGETPLDCAPTTLQYKMQKKMEEGGQKS